MGENSEISWTHHTFNPWIGCVEVSPACDNCYARSEAKRRGWAKWGKVEPRHFTSDQYWKQPLKWNREAEALGERKRVFCGSLCDVMEDREDLNVHRHRLYELIAKTPHLDWLLLTKRPQNFRRFLPARWLSNPAPNVWGMTTVEGADHAWRIQALVETPFRIRGLSMEPLLGPVDLRQVRWNNGRGNAMDVLRGGLWHPLHGFIQCSDMGRIHLVIAGGESGSRARPSDPDWFRSLRDQCVEAVVPFHFKQFGEFDADLVRIGNKKSGRLLDGRTWDEMPEVSNAI